VATRREIIWTPGARTDLDEIVAYIASDSPAAALAFLEEVFSLAESLSTLSERGRIVPELADPRVRELLFHKYRLFYEVHGNEVTILGVLHGAREFRKGE
jgi:plasmid stabilization system protein ParE